MQPTFIFFLFATTARNSGKESKTSLTLSSSQEAEECAQEEREEVKEALAPLLSNRALEAELRKQMAASLERRHAEALSSSQAAGHKVSLLNVLQQGWDLRSAPCLPRQPSIITTSSPPPELCLIIGKISHLGEIWFEKQA